jgi:DNA polymerase III subunit alpha
MFTHLHLHTEYSLLDATIRVNDLIEKLKDTGMKSCAITDHGNMYGTFKFYQGMKAAGLKPILGCEIYIAPRDMKEKEYGIDNEYFHLVVLAKNLEGYKNLVKIVSLAHMDGFYYKPRIDLKTLSKYTEGLIALSACLGGPISKPILKKNFKEAKEKAQVYKNMFKDNFFIELQRNGMEEQEIVNEGLLKIAKELDLPLVATCDSHYLNKEDAEIQEILWCISDGYTMDDVERRKMPTNEFYVKSPEEMKELFKDIPEAVENTKKISEIVEDFDITFDMVQIPYPDLPKGKTSKEYLKELTYEGVKEKYGELTKDLEERVEYELEIIHDKGYDDYFLVVRDFVKFCRSNDIVVGMRGSGCGSVVAYATDITDIEPIEWELYFERFLNPGRPSPPDFDLDIADKRRDEVIEYTIDKYGLDCVKQIGTFSKLQTRQAIRDVARVINIDLEIADELSKMVEVVFGKTKSIEYMLEHNPEFAQIINSSEKTRHLADVVKKVSGLCRGVSTHACGIIITPKPVVEYCPIQRDAHGEGIGMSQYEMSDVEGVGLMKFDFLGLRNLNIIGSALKKIENSKNIKIDLRKIDQRDKKTYDLLKSGYTIGVFQLESEGMKRTIRMLEPGSLEDICYILSAYRPGPMQFIPEYSAVKKGKQEPDYIIDDLEPILSITNGVITYQEQVMKIAEIIAGYSLSEADILRRAMGKKKLDIMEAEKPRFIEGGAKNGYNKKDVEKIWKRLVQFANYGFNKAHSAQYATIAYWTAYLKANYPLEYMAALLEGDLENFDRVILDLKDCERLGIEVLSPDINKSDYYFTVEENKSIRFGLGGIKNIGGELVKLVVKERQKNGKYEHLDDFVNRNFNEMNKKAIEYLIMSGTMDTFGDRSALLHVLPEIYDREKANKRSEEMGQIDIFSIDNNGKKREKEIEKTTLPINIKTETSEILKWEKELLGLYFSSHPLDNLNEFFELKGVQPLDMALEEKKNNEAVILGVMVTKIRKITTKKGDMMAFLSIEDKTAKSDAIVFPRTYKNLKESLQENKPMLIVGRLNVRDGEKSIVIQKAKYIDEKKHSSKFDGITFKITPNHTEEEIAELKSFIQSSDGKTAVKIIVKNESKTKKVILKKKIAMNEDTKKWLKRF